MEDKTEKRRGRPVGSKTKKGGKICLLTRPIQPNAVGY